MFRDNAIHFCDFHKCIPACLQIAQTTKHVCMNQYTKAMKFMKSNNGRQGVLCFIPSGSSVCCQCRKQFAVRSPDAAPAPSLTRPRSITFIADALSFMRFELEPHKAEWLEVKRCFRLVRNPI